MKFDRRASDLSDTRRGEDPICMKRRAELVRFTVTPREKGGKKRQRDDRCPLSLELEGSN